MRKTMMACTFLMGTFFCLGPYTIGMTRERDVSSVPSWSEDPYRGRERGRNDEAKYRCGIFSKSPRAHQREYSSCESCVQENGRCEERCAEVGYVCTATGYARRSFSQTVQSDLTDSRQRAERKAMRKCTDAGLHRCTLGQCREIMNFDPTRVTPCPSYERPSRRRDENNNRHNTVLPRISPNNNRYNNTVQPRMTPNNNRYNNTVQPRMIPNNNR